MAFVDVHHHVIPPVFRQLWNSSAKIPKSLILPEWNLEMSLALMDETNITHAILSLGHQIPHLIDDKAEAAAICKKMNVYMAEQRDKHPERLGFLATLPSLSDTRRCIEVITHALDVLKADGAMIATSYHGQYLGADIFKPVWQVLEERAVVVAFHPYSEAGGLTPERHPIPGPIIDWSHETTRTVTHLIATGRTRDLQKCKIILPHAGGTLPFVAQRIAHVAADVGMTIPPEEFFHEAQRFYFDLAVSGFEFPFSTLKRFAQPEHILFGSDFPFVSQELIKSQCRLIERSLKGEEGEASVRRNVAFKLFPSLKEPEH